MWKESITSNRYTSYCIWICFESTENFDSEINTEIDTNEV